MKAKYIVTTIEDKAIDFGTASYKESSNEAIVDVQRMYSDVALVAYTIEEAEAIWNA